MITYDFSITGTDEAGRSGDSEGAVYVVRTKADYDALPQGMKPMNPDEGDLICEGQEGENFAHRIGPLNNGQFVPFLTDDLGTRLCASCHIVEHLSLLGLGTVIEDKMSGVHLVGASYDHLHDHIAELAVFFNNTRHTETLVDFG